MNDPEKRCFELLQYGVELFKYHADQRLRCIRYYIAMFWAIIAGGIVGIDRILGKQEICSQLIPSIILFCTFASAGITFFFWLLDIRNRVLTECAENGLKKTEDILFGKENDWKINLKIVSNCDHEKQAWHYGQILPIFFKSIISILIIVSIIIAFRSSSTHIYCLLSSLLILIQFAMLICGWYAESKFSETKRKRENIT